MDNPLTTPIGVEGVSLPPEHGLPRGGMPTLPSITPLQDSPLVRQKDAVKTTQNQPTNIKAEDANGEIQKGRQTQISVTSTDGTNDTKTEMKSNDMKASLSVTTADPSKDGWK